MTIDDENSIYVGGLPYDCSEEAIREAFDLYGKIVAVKIINDHDVGGKCYGFVTFTNPRSAVDAMGDMDGGKIGGRVIRVNEVKTRGGNPHFNKGINHRDTQRYLDGDRDRDRERYNDFDRERYRDRNMGRSRDRDRDWETKSERSRGHDRSKDRFGNDDQDQDRDRENGEQPSRKQDLNSGRNVDLDWDRDRELDRTTDHDRRANHKDKGQQAMDRTGSSFIARRSRELSSNSTDSYQDQVKERLEQSLQKAEELQEEISQIQGKLDEREKYFSDLQKKAQKLEDVLASAKKTSSHRRIQLTKFQTCLVQVNDYTSKLRSSEQELQSLVDMVMSEADDVEDPAVMDSSVYVNGKAGHAEHW